MADLKSQERETFPADLGKAHEGEIRIHSAAGKPGRIISGRLLPGTDLVGGILELARSHRVRAGAIVTAFGSLSRARFSLGIRPSAGHPGELERIPPRIVEGPMEFLGGQGKFGFPPDGDPVIHFHGVVVGSDGQVTGGHFFPGETPVFATFEVVLQEILGVDHLWRWDDEVGVFLIEPLGTVPVEGDPP